MEEHGNSTIAKSFLADIKPLITHYGLFFLTVDDLNTFFEHQDFYDLFKQYLQQHHNATQKDKKEAARLVVFGPEHPIDNIAERLNCFNTNTNVNSSDVHYVTLYVYQPDPLLEISYVDSKRNAGHTWLGISQVAQGQATELNVGLYPESAANPWEQDDPGKYSDDYSHPYDVKVTWEIQATKFNSLINHLKANNTPPNYHLSNFNCTTFALRELTLIGIEAPKTIGAWLLGAGLNPQDLGEDIRDPTWIPPFGGIKNTSGGTSPNSTCQ